MKTNTTVQQEFGESLIVSTPKGQVRLKQCHNLNALPTAMKVVSNIPQSSSTPQPIAEAESSVTPTKTDAGTVTTHYGHVVRPPPRLIDE